MALTVKNYELPDGQILEDAYLKVQNITTAIVDYEHIQPSEVPGFDFETTYIKKIESTANIFVYADKKARENMVAAIHWFPVKFDYSLSDWSNIFEQAYKTTREMFEEYEDN